MKRRAEMQIEECLLIDENPTAADEVDAPFKKNIAFLFKRFSKESLTSYLKFYYKNQKINKLSYICSKISDWSSIPSSLVYLIEAKLHLPGIPKIPFTDFDKETQKHLANTIIEDPTIELLSHRDNFLTQAIIHNNLAWFKELLGIDALILTLAADAEPLELLIDDPSKFAFLDLILNAKINLPWEYLWLYLCKKSQSSDDVLSSAKLLVAYPHCKQKITSLNLWTETIKLGSETLVRQLSRDNEIHAIFNVLKHYFFWACKHNDNDIISHWLEERITLPRWMEAMSIALRNNNSDLVATLAKNKPKINKHNWNMLVKTAFEINSLDIIDILLTQFGFVLAKGNFTSYIKKEILPFPIKQYLFLYGEKHNIVPTKDSLEKMLGFTLSLEEKDLTELAEKCKENGESFFHHLCALINTLKENPHKRALYTGLIRCALIQEEALLSAFFDPATSLDLIGIHFLLIDEIFSLSRTQGLPKTKIHSFLALVYDFVQPLWEQEDYVVHASPLQDYYVQQIKSRKEIFFELSLYACHSNFVLLLQTLSFTTEDYPKILLKLIKKVDETSLAFFEKHFLEQPFFRTDFTSHHHNYLQVTNKKLMNPLFSLFIKTCRQQKTEQKKIIHDNFFMDYGNEDFCRERQDLITKNYDLFDWDYFFVDVAKNLDRNASLPEKDLLSVFQFLQALEHIPLTKEQRKQCSSLQKSFGKKIIKNCILYSESKLPYVAKVMRICPFSRNELCDIFKEFPYRKESHFLPYLMEFFYNFKTSFIVQMPDLIIQLIFAHAALKENMVFLEKLSQENSTNLAFSSDCFVHLLAQNIPGTQYEQAFKILFSKAKADNSIHLEEQADIDKRRLKNLERNTLILSKQTLFYVRPQPAYKFIKINSLLTQGVEQFEGSFSEENPLALSCAKKVAHANGLSTLFHHYLIHQKGDQHNWVYPFLQGKLSLDMILSAEGAEQELYLWKQTIHCYLLLKELEKSDQYYMLPEIVFLICQTLLEKVLAPFSEEKLQNYLKIGTATT